jgi:hypothetical protein
VSECLSEYPLICSERLIDATIILLCELECHLYNRSAHCEGKNDCQPHKLSTLFFSQHLPGLRTGERALRVRFGTSEYGVTRTFINMRNTRQIRRSLQHLRVCREDELIPWTRGEMIPHQRDPVKLAARYIEPPMTTQASQATAQQRQILRLQLG